MIQVINKSLLEADTKYIVHQCNCVSRNSAGIAKAIFDKFPWANTYTTRENPSKRGNIDVLGNGNKERFIINAYIQYYPGKPQTRNYGKVIDRSTDSYNNRIFYLQKCLDKIEMISNLKSIGFPEGMGSRLAGGNWNDYLSILEDFAKRIKSDQGAETFLYNYDSNIKPENTQEPLWK